MKEKKRENSLKEAMKSKEDPYLFHIQVQWYEALGRLQGQRHPWRMSQVCFRPKRGRKCSEERLRIQRVLLMMACEFQRTQWKTLRNWVVVGKGSKWVI